LCILYCEIYNFTICVQTSIIHDENDTNITRIHVICLPFSSLWFESVNRKCPDVGWWFMVSCATFNNISVISWRLVLLVEEIGVPREDHRPVASHWQTLSHNVVSSTPRLSGVRTHKALIAQVVVNPTGSCKSNYHTITTKTATVQMLINVKRIRKGQSRIIFVLYLLSITKCYYDQIDNTAFFTISSYLCHCS
jgi:hypothetical protein